MRTYNLGFILEQTLGHVTHTKNLQANVPRDPEVHAHWMLLPFEPTGLHDRLPLVKSNWGVRSALLARRALAAQSRQTRFDALFFHTQVPAVLSTNWVRRIPSVVSLDATPLQFDTLGSFYSHGQGSLVAEKLKWKLNRDCYQAARHLIAWSEWTKRSLINDYQIASENITVIPPGVNTREWRRPTARAAHEGPVKILFVGADLERKGGMLLLNAFRAVRELGVELHLATRATLPNEPGLFVYNDLKPNSPALKQLYYDCDVFCLPTSGDCLPMVLSEAGATGLPTISTRLAGIPEIVREGETGLLIAPGNLDGLIAALRQLIVDPAMRLQFGTQAIAYVGREFDAERNANRLLELLKLVAAPARKEGSAVQWRKSF